MALSCLPGASQAVQLILSCLPGASQAVQMVRSYFPGASLAVRWILSCLPGASQAVQMVLSCFPGASLSKAILCSERHCKGQSVLRAANRGAHPRICREPGRSPLKLYCKLYKIWRPSKTGTRSAILCDELPWCLPGGPCPMDPVLPPWCLSGCPNGPFLPPWCLPVKGDNLPGASQAVQMALSCLPGASLVN